MRSSPVGSPARLKIPGSGPMIDPQAPILVPRQSSPGLLVTRDTNAPARQQNNPPTSNGEAIGVNVPLPAPQLINSSTLTTQPLQIISSSP